MAHIIGCTEAHELSTCKQGANQHAHIILRKSMTPPENPQPVVTEKTDMDAVAIQKAAKAIALKLASLSEVAKSYVASLDDAAQDAILEKSAIEIEAVAKSAADEAKRMADEEEARKSGKTPEFIELQKSNQALRQELDALKAKDAIRDIEKRAATEFAGFPGGPVEAAKQLQDIAGLPEDARKRVETMMKAQCQTASAMLKGIGIATEQDLTKAQTAQKRLSDAVDAYVVEKKVSRSVAVEKVSELREHAADVEAVTEAGLAF